MDARQAFMLYACPALGAAVAFVMFVSPLRAVLAVHRSKELGALNPVPFIAMVGSGLGWLAYGLVIHDYFVFCSNISALLLGMFYVMTCSKFCQERVADQLRNILLCVCCLFVAMSLVYMAAGLDAAGNKTLWGSNAVAILAVYYISPLSTLAKVLSSRDSSSLHRPLLAANIANGLLWFAYGLATRDWFIIGPNGVGAAFSIISLVISLVLPAKARHNLTSADTCQNSGSTHQRPDRAASGCRGSERLDGLMPDDLADSVCLKSMATGSNVQLSRVLDKPAFKLPGVAGSIDVSRAGNQGHDTHVDVEAARG